MDKYHTPVLTEEIIRGLEVHSGKRYIDATFGGGGHTKAIVSAGGSVLAFDIDADAIVHGKQTLTADGFVCVSDGVDERLGLRVVDLGQIILVQASYINLAVVASALQFRPVAGIVFDLGVSSHQIDEPSRGFSYRYANAPLDMRFDQQQSLRGQDLINSASEEELYGILATFGEEERARAIAHAIVSARKVVALATAGDLANIVSDLVGTGPERTKVLSRVYQALRIAVNDELGQIKQALAISESLLPRGGRLAIISFHSLEDRLVKQFFRKRDWIMTHKKTIVPSQTELDRNRRAHSAKLRIGERV